MIDGTAAPAPLPAETTSSPAPTSATEPAAPASITDAKPAVAEPAAFVPLTAESFTLPEGFTLDPEASTTFLGIMNNRDLTPAQQAQSLIELQASLVTKSSEMGSQAWKDQQAAWQAEISADPVLGGANMEKTIAGIGSLMTRFADDNVRAAFNETGAGNNPHIIRFLTTLVGQLKEPSPILPGSPAGGAGRSLEDRLYPSAT